MKITKKAIKEAPKFIMTLDPKACGANNVEGFYKALGSQLYYKTLAATNILEAMAEAESYYDETTYLISLEEKTVDADANTDGVVYREILATRGCSNWHLFDKAHSETPALIAYNPEYKFFQVIGFDW